VNHEQDAHYYRNDRERAPAEGYKFTAAPPSKYPYRVVVVQFRRTPSIVDASGTGTSAIDKAANPQGS
jgi:hypothetical protein